VTCILDAVATLAPSIQDAVKDFVTAATDAVPVADAVKDSAAKDSAKDAAQAPLQDLKELKDLTDAPKLEDGLQAQAAQQSTAGANSDDFVLAAPVTRNMGKKHGKSHQKKNNNNKTQR
jgi:hypothetical protein